MTSQNTRSNTYLKFQLMIPEKVNNGHSMTCFHCPLCNECEGVNQF